MHIPKRSMYLTDKEYLQILEHGLKLTQKMQIQDRPEKI